MTAVCCTAGRTGKLEAAGNHLEVRHGIKQKLYLQETAGLAHAKEHPTERLRNTRFSAQLHGPWQSSFLPKPDQRMEEGWKVRGHVHPSPYALPDVTRSRALQGQGQPAVSMHT